MKLFDGYEAVRFPEENLIFVTHNGYLYYVYNPKYNSWRKHRSAGNDHITVCNYPDISRDELEAAMQGVFPEKETDFMRLCDPAQLCIRDMLDLLKVDYASHMSNCDIYHTVHRFLLKSNIRYKAFEEISKLLGCAAVGRYNTQKIIDDLKDTCFRMLGRDIFKKEIGIVDGHDSSSYFWIMPVRVIDYEDADSLGNVAEMRCVEISIEEDDVDQYLRPFLYAHFNEELEANKKRHEAKGFEWYLTYNFFTFSSIEDILKDIKDTIDALTTGRETGFTKVLLKKGSTENALIIDFYQRFLYRMEYMMRVGNEKGYDLISFMGP